MFKRIALLVFLLAGSQVQAQTRDWVGTSLNSVTYTSAVTGRTSTIQINMYNYDGGRPVTRSSYEDKPPVRDYGPGYRNDECAQRGDYCGRALVMPKDPPARK